MTAMSLYTVVANNMHPNSYRILIEGQLGRLLVNIRNPCNFLCHSYLDKFALFTAARMWALRRSLEVVSGRLIIGLKTMMFLRSARMYRRLCQDK